MFQDVTRAAEPDDVKGAVVIGMMRLNALGLAFRARLRFEPSVSLQKMNDQASIALALKDWVLTVLASVGLMMRPPLLSFRWIYHPLTMTNSVFGTLARCGRIGMHTSFTPISYAERPTFRFGKLRQRSCCETSSAHMRIESIPISDLGLEGFA